MTAHRTITAGELAHGHLIRLGASQNYVRVASAVPDESGRIAVTIYAGEIRADGPYRRFGPAEPVTVSAFSLDAADRPRKAA